MDFATISNLVQSSGYNKAMTNTSNSLTNYDTLFKKGNNKISVHWQIGGYVHSVSVGDSNGTSEVFDCANSFIASFSEN